MRAEANQFKAVVVGFGVDQNEVRLDVAITAIVHRADQWVIDSIGGNGLSSTSRLMIADKNESSFLTCFPDCSRR